MTLATCLSRPFGANQLQETSRDVSAELNVQGHAVLQIGRLNLARGWRGLAEHVLGRHLQSETKDTKQLEKLDHRSYRSLPGYAAQPMGRGRRPSARDAGSRRIWCGSKQGLELSLAVWTFLCVMDRAVLLCHPDRLSLDPGTPAFNTDIGWQPSMTDTGRRATSPIFNYPPAWMTTPSCSLLNIALVRSAL
jgi:hypothetical protein